MWLTETLGWRKAGAIEASMEKKKVQKSQLNSLGIKRVSLRKAFQLKVCMKVCMQV